MSTMEEELVGVLREMEEKSTELSQKLEAYAEQVRSGEIKIHGGLSFFQVKCSVFLSYLAGLTVFAALKTEGRPIAEHPVLDLLIEARVVLEKMKPIGETMKYQIGKMMNLAKNGAEDDEELQYGPSVSAMTEENGGEDDGENVANDGKYRPPRIAAVHFTDGHDKEVEREKQREEREKARARKSSGIRELMAEFTDRPEEIRENNYEGSAAQEVAKMDEQRKKFEEDYFVRTTMSKKDKKVRRDLLRKARDQELDGGDLRDLVTMTDRLQKKDKSRRRESMLREKLASDSVNSTDKNSKFKKYKSKRSNRR